MALLWIPITLIASLLQTVRNAAQRSLTGDLSALGATYTRFVFGFPFALVYAALVFLITRAPMPVPGIAFWAWATAAAVAQIIGTACLLLLFQLRNFSVGTVLSKTEILLTAIFGLLFLGDRPTALAGIAIIAATVGLLILSHDETAGSWHASLRALWGKPALYGLATGACFAIASVGFRAASISLKGLGFVPAASLTLVLSTLIQSMLMTLYLHWREPGQVATVLRLWRRSTIPGIAGGAASACWFTAMTIEIAAYVRMLSLLEVVYSYAVSVFRFHEQLKLREVIGSVIVTAAILLLLADRADLFR